MNCAKWLCRALVLLAFSSSAHAVDQPPPLPKGYELALGDSGDFLWGQMDFGFRRRTGYTYQRLRVASGDLEAIPLPVDFAANAAVAVGDDVIAVGSPSVFPAKDGLSDEIVWHSSKGGVARAKLPLQRHRGHMLALADRSVLLVGGRLASDSARTNAVERVQRTPKGLAFERLPDIPGPVRHSYALVALADGRAMVLGGSDYTYTGCATCLADTYFLDPKTKTWTDGPKMIERRADATATLLPDGSVLVAGGWTPGHDWNEEASRTTERWDPRHNAFTAGPPLPIAVAMQTAQWAAGPPRRLLLAGGMARAWESNDSILAYDIAANQWRTVGENCQGNSKGGGRVQFGSRLHSGMLFAWCGSGLSGEHREAPLRTSAIAIDGERGFALRRSGTVLSGQGALLAASGTMADTGTLSAAVDLFGTDGQLRTLAPLNHARRDARAFFLPGGGYLVTGGIGGLLLDRRHPTLPMEWLPAGSDIAQARWRDLDPWFTPQDATAQEVDGSLLLVSPAGSVERLRMEFKDGQLRAERTALPGLGRPRESAEHGSQSAKVRVRSLADGNIVVAGGLQRQSSVAVLDENSLDEGAVDTYVELGDQEISRRYEIYDLASRTWHTSVPAEGQGGPVAILDTGQVVMLTPSRITGEQRSDGTWPRTQGLMEISSVDGRSWQQIASAPKVRLDDHARLFVLQGKLLLAGESDGQSTGGGTALLQWYDAAHKRWVTLWEAPPHSNWREHQGRVILRELDGNRLLIPIEGP